MMSFRHMWCDLFCTIVIGASGSRVILISCISLGAQSSMRWLVRRAWSARSRCLLHEISTIYGQPRYVTALTFDDIISSKNSFGFSAMGDHCGMVTKSHEAQLRVILPFNLGKLGFRRPRTLAWCHWNPYLWLRSPRLALKRGSLISWYLRAFDISWP